MPKTIDHHKADEQLVVQFKKRCQNPSGELNI